MTRDFLFSMLEARMHDQANRIDIPILFRFDRNGMRLGIAAIEDEANELYEEWRDHKNTLGDAVMQIRHELLDIAAVAMHVLEQTYAEEPKRGR